MPELPKHKCRNDVPNDMRRWLGLNPCRTEVRAFKIGIIGPAPDGAVYLLPEDLGLADVRAKVSPEYLKKHNPQVGGYYVLDCDGGESYLPAEMFEVAYTNVERN